MGNKSKTANEKLRETLLEYLNTHNTMTIATAQDNVPWAVAVFYPNDGFTIYYSSDSDTRSALYAAVLTRATRRSVSLCYTEEEHVAPYSVRMESCACYKAGMKKDGKVTVITGDR
jgi:hypothetical protein